MFKGANQLSSSIFNLQQLFRCFLAEGMLKCICGCRRI
jgi:hypothetical protein